MSGVTVPTPNPLYPSTSAEKPQLLCIDFTEDPTGSLGAQLVNFDKVRKLHGFGWLLHFRLFWPGRITISRCHCK